MKQTYEQFGYAILSAVAKKNNPVGEAVDFLIKHTEAWDSISRSMRRLEEYYTKSEPYTCAFTEMIKQEFEKQFKKDMIYYTICYDGFRL